MGRKRSVSPVDIYHVVERGTGKQIVFENDDDRNLFLSLMRRFAKDGHVEIYAWCLMSNHVHLLLHGAIEDVSRYMEKLVGDYAKHFNAARKRTGHLFQDRFWSEPIDDESYLLTVIRYIHYNPQNAGVAPYDQYEWSSYSEYMNVPTYCETRFPLSVFGGKQAFALFHQRPSPPISSKLMMSLSDDDVNALASESLGIPLDTIKSYPKEERDCLLRMLHKRGLGVRQLERLTGISKSVISRALS